MLDSETPTGTTPDSGTESGADPAVASGGESPPAKAAAKKAAKKTAAKKAPAKKTTAKKSAAKQAATSDDADQAVSGQSSGQSSGPSDGGVTAEPPTAGDKPAAKTAAAKPATKKAATKKAATKKAAAKKSAPRAESAAGSPGDPAADSPMDAADESADGQTAAGTMLLFKAPEPVKTPVKRAKKAAPKAEPAPDDEDADEARVSDPEASDDESEDDSAEGAARRRRRRGGRRRRKGAGGEGGDEDSDESSESSETETPAKATGDAEEPAETTTRRRRVRARSGERAGGDDQGKTTSRVRQSRGPEDEIAGFTGSTRLEAKKQRRREGREAGRRRAPIISEAEFLARREAVERVMVIRQRDDLTQIAVLEDKVLVEHYVARESQTSLIGNVYLGRVQNVLPSMEAAFIDIGKGRNAVLYAGEVNWDALGGKEGTQRKIESVLKPGQAVLVQVTKDPVGHKGARLTSQISLPGRFLVYVPDGTTSGISRKLPDTERNRLKTLLKEIVPETAGVIVRTAAEGASEEELTRDVERLTARWNDISAKVENGNAPALLYGEPDLTLKVVRDLFTEDFAKLVISGSEAWETVQSYVEHVAPDLAERLERHDDSNEDAFAAYRIDEQIAKALDRKVWLPSGGSLIIDRTEAMTVIDVNTGKFTGSGGNLEETVTKNNLEAAEEIVRQLRLRDIGGIIVVDFIDMVLESNRDLVLRRLVECLGRDRTRHQVAEVTSLGLVQMTRKRIGTGLLEAFSETCEHCQGRGLLVHHEPVEPKKKVEEEPRRARRGRGRGKAGADDGFDSADTGGNSNGSSGRTPTPADLAALPRHDDAHEHEHDDDSVAETPSPTAEKAAPRRRRGSTASSQAAESTDSTESTDTAEGAESRSQRPGTDPTDGDPAADAAADSSDTVDAGSAASEPASAAPEPSPEPAPESAPESAPEPGSADDSAAVGEPDSEQPAAPKIVTSVRRVGARRAAGPPKPVAGAAVDTLEAPPSEPATVNAHVPIKKKGARKR